MKSAIPSSAAEDTNNRLVNPNGQLIVELMQALQRTKKQAEENPQEAELNRTTMSDNNGGRIIYNFNVYQIPQILGILKARKTIKKNDIEPK